MFPFSKPSTPRTILCLPGSWTSQSDIVTSIATANLGEFIFAGKVLMNLKTGKGFTLEVHDRDDRMRESFELAGRINGVSKEFLNEIDKHTHVIYIIGDTGNLSDAKAIADAGVAILKAGGIGLKVESAGKAFMKEQWNKLVTEFEESNLYEMYVVDNISDGKGTTYSCGMHNLGFKDTIVSDLEFKEAVRLINIFGYYQLVDKPTIKDNQTFGVAKNEPVFVIKHESNQPYKGVELFENPYGMWRLKRK